MQDAIDEMVACLQVTPDTLFFATSTESAATSIAHVLVERGKLSYEQRVADGSREFGAHGKGDVTLRDGLVHAAGVPGLWPLPRVARQSPDGAEPPRPEPGSPLDRAVPPAAANRRVRQPPRRPAGGYPGTGNDVRARGGADVCDAARPHRWH